jgi:hypothetical protein
MLAKLFGKKSDHPLAEMKSVQSVLSDVPKADAIKALQELSGWVESLREHASEFKPEHGVAVLFVLDEAAQPHVRKLLRDYFSVQPLNKFQENRMWSALNDYFAQSEPAYADILGRCRKGERYAAALKPQLSLLVTRAIVAASHRLLLAAVRYAPIDPALWAHLAEAYAYAESQNLQDEPLALYPGITAGTTVQREFAAVMVWFSVTAGSLSPLHIRIVERLIAHLNKYLTAGMPASAGRWAINLVQPTPPMRVSTETTIHSSLRFIGIGEMEAVLENLLKTLGKGFVPQDINMGGAEYPAELVRDVALQLLARCRLPLPTRRNPRRSLKVNLHVANGFSKLLENTDTGLNFNGDGHAVWEVEDISASGFRSVVAPDVLDSVKIGSLIGSKPENVAGWGVGIVRRLSRDEQNNLHVGVEVLSNQVSGVALGARDHGGADGDNLALYLNRPSDNSGEAWLLMNPGAFLNTRSFNMRVAEKNYLLLPLGMVESGEDYDLARYRKMGQDVGE